MVHSRAGYGVEAGAGRLLLAPALSAAAQGGDDGTDAKGLGQHGMPGDWNAELDLRLVQARASSTEILIIGFGISRSVDPLIAVDRHGRYRDWLRTGLGRSILDSLS